MQEGLQWRGRRRNREEEIISLGCDDAEELLHAVVDTASMFVYVCLYGRLYAPIYVCRVKISFKNGSLNKHSTCLFCVFVFFLHQI